jgi:hypothetical protein
MALPSDFVKSPEQEEEERRQQAIKMEMSVDPNTHPARTIHR